LSDAVKAVFRCVASHSLIAERRREGLPGESRAKIAQFYETVTKGKQQAQIPVLMDSASVREWSESQAERLVEKMKRDRQLLVFPKPTCPKMVPDLLSSGIEKPSASGARISQAGMQIRLRGIDWTDSLLVES
jgi:hypothetical protein